MPSATLLSPIGVLRIHADANAVTALTIDANDSVDGEGSALADDAAAQVRAYLERRLERFDLQLAPARSPRGAALRAAIADIPWGQATSYGALARIAGSSPRAIGQACARNPLPIIIPCHRILASGGRIGHYSAGAGMPTKRWLLDHEGTIRHG